MATAETAPLPLSCPVLSEPDQTLANFCIENQFLYGDSFLAHLLRCRDYSTICVASTLVHATGHFRTPICQLSGHTLCSLLINFAPQLVQAISATHDGNWRILVISDNYQQVVILDSSQTAVYHVGSLIGLKNEFQHELEDVNLSQKYISYTILKKSSITASYRDNTALPKLHRL